MKFFPYQLKRQIKTMQDKHFYPAISNIDGNILEIGIGQGDNFKYYSKNCTVIAIDKNLDENISENLSKEVNCSVNYLRNVIEDINIENGTLDYAVGTFVLCSVESVEIQIKTIYEKLQIG